jgi:hypothetical protein
MTPNVVAALRLAVALSLPLAAANAQQLREQNSGHTPEARFEITRMVAGDLDGDARVDLLLAQHPQLQFDGAELLWRNEGHARFRDVSSRLPASAGTFTRDLVLADVDGDSDLDVFVCGGDLRLWINDGNHSFVDKSIGRLPAGLVNDTVFGLALDVDGDGDLDFVRIGSATDDVLWNDGQGTFTLGAPLPFTRSVTGARQPFFSPQRGVVADFDGDGIRDLFLVGGGVESCVQFAGDGRGGFARRAHGLTSAFVGAKDVAAADFDNDGDLDLAIGCHGNPSVQPVRTVLLRNGGDGTFTDVTATAMPNAFDTHAVCFVDLDRDGAIDLVIATDGQPIVMRGNGAGAFAVAPPPMQPSASREAAQIVASDFDGDGFVDLAFVSVRRGAGTTTSVEIHANQGGASLALLNAPRLPREPTAATRILTADLDGDGDVDLWCATPRGVVLRWNDGNASFTAAAPTQVPVSTAFECTATALADHDGDGDVDAFVALADRSRVLLDNDGRGGFTVRAMPNAPRIVTDAQYFDADGDGDLDLVLAADVQSELWINDGAGNFTLAPVQPTPMDRTRAVVAGDVDGDGDVDLVFANLRPTGFGSHAVLQRNDGSGGFTAVPTGAFTVGFPALAAQFFDYDADRDLDLVVVSEASVGLFLNDGRGGFRNLTDGRIPLIRYGIGVSVVDIDGDGVTEILVPRSEGGPVALRKRGNVYVVATDVLPIEAVHLGGMFAVVDLDRDGDMDAVLARGPQAPGQGDLLLLNVDHQIESPFTPALGRPFELRLHRVNVNGSGAQAAATFVSLGALPTRLAVPPFGEFGLDPTSMIALPVVAIPAATGTAVVPLTLPSLGALHGLPFCTQALIAPAGDPSAWRLTNVTVQTIVW